MSSAVQDLLSILDLEQLEVNLFRGRSPATGWQRVFGGQVIGQALVATCRTVDDVKARLDKVSVSYDYTKRLSRYFRMKWEALDLDENGKIVVVDRQLLRKVVELLKGIYTDVSEHPDRYDGVISRNVVNPSVYMGKELTRMKRKL